MALLHVQDTTTLNPIALETSVNTDGTTAVSVQQEERERYLYLNDYRYIRSSARFTALTTATAMQNSLACDAMLVHNTGFNDRNMFVKTLCVEVSSNSSANGNVTVELLYFAGSSIPSFTGTDNSALYAHKQKYRLDSEDPGHIAVKTILNGTFNVTGPSLYAYVQRFYTTLGSSATINVPIGPTPLKVEPEAGFVVRVSQSTSSQVSYVSVTAETFSLDRDDGYNGEFPRVDFG